MAHTISLDINQRIKTCNLLSQSRGTTGDYRLNCQLMDLLELSSDEIKEHRVSARDVEALGIRSFHWDPSDDFTRAFELKPALWMRLKALFETSQFTPQDRPWLEPILEQLGI